MPETTELMKRPTMSDELVKRRALELFMPAVKKYLGTEWSERENSFIEKQLMDVMDEFSDGYHMARQLERKGWAEDRSLVDLMDEGESYQIEAHKELLSQWILCYGISPERKLGDNVVTDIYEREEQIGVIFKFYIDEAKYGVRYPDQRETECYVVEYERVQDVPEIA